MDGPARKYGYGPTSGSDSMVTSTGPDDQKAVDGAGHPRTAISCNVPSWQSAST